MDKKLKKVYLIVRYMEMMEKEVNTGLYIQIPFRIFFPKIYLQLL